MLLLLWTGVQCLIKNLKQAISAGHLSWRSIRAAKSTHNPGTPLHCKQSPNSWVQPHPAHCYLLRWIFHQEWQDFFFPSPSLPSPLSYLLAWQLVTATSLPRWLSLKPDLCRFLRPVVAPSLSHSNHFWQETCWSQQQVLAPETHWDYTGKSGYSVLSPS